MNADILRCGGIDYDRGVKRFAGRVHLFEKALTKFTRDATFSRLRAAFEAGDRAALFACAHEFKGMCGNIGLDSLYEAAGAMVNSLRGDAVSEEQLAAAYEALANEYHTVYGAVIAAMEGAL